MISGIITIIGGIIAAAALITKFVPNSEKAIDKLTPYTGWIGTLMFAWGVWEVIQAVLNVSLLGDAPLTWIFWLCVGLADLGVGFLLGFGLITKYALSKNEQALAKGQAIRSKLVPFQAIMGIFAMVMGVLYILF